MPSSVPRETLYVLGLAPERDLAIGRNITAMGRRIEAQALAQIHERAEFQKRLARLERRFDEANAALQKLVSGRRAGAGAA